MKELTAEIAQFESYEELLSPIKRHPTYRKSGKALTKEDEVDIKKKKQKAADGTAEAIMRTGEV
ncbi:hypothetical protein BsIDN1_18400 [Bacillus safensis]|uniref:Uncharacterized protein n=1 Tax=Bacillus safensis TaxID=561879 RepID=A0A5S9M6G2_BACIA|nr:hypothetical protein BsIDN1_18400 [Bacillus safensis]